MKGKNLYSRFCCFQKTTRASGAPMQAIYIHEKTTA